MCSSADIAFLLCVAGVGLAVSSLGQPEPLNSPVWAALELADGVPAWGHVMLPPEQGVVLGCYTSDYPGGYPTACWWDLKTGERHDLTDAVEVDGVLYTPRLPEPGVDPATGSTVWRCRSEAGDWIPAAVTIPAAVRSADFNADGSIDTRDVTAFLSAWDLQREGHSP